MLVSLLVGAFAGCAPDQAATQPLARDQVLTWPYYGGDLVNYGMDLDPAVISTAFDLGTISMLYSGLVNFDSNINAVKDSAADIQIDQTGTIYTFRLKDTLKFSDGKQITADDYAYSIDRALDPNLCSGLYADTYATDASGVCDGRPGAEPYAYTYLSSIVGADARAHGNGDPSTSLISKGDDPNKGLNVIDSLTLKIRLTAPSRYFLQALTYPTAYPVERSLVEKYGGKWVDHLDEGGCSGPFKIKSYNDRKSITLVPNPYWEDANKKLTIQRVERPILPGQEDIYKAYRTGSYDVAEVPTDEYDRARGQADFFEIPALSTEYFGLNLKMAPFDNDLVRQAFALSLNKQLLVDRIQGGGALPTNHIIPRGMPGYNPNLTQLDGTQSLTGNQDRATQLLDQARGACTGRKQPDYCAYIAGDNKQDIIIHVRESATARARLSDGAAQQWSAALKLNVKVERNSSAEIRRNTKPNGPYQIWAIGWIADYPDPQDWLSVIFASNASNNGFNLNDKALDDLLHSADIEQDADKRKQIYNDAEQQLINKVPWIPFQQPKYYWRQRTWVHGFSFNPLQVMVNTNWPNVYITAH